MPNIKSRGTKPVAKRISRAQGLRLATTELTSGVRYKTSKEERRAPNAQPRRPKITVREADGKVIVTTRRRQKPRAKQVFTFLQSTAPLKKRWKAQMKNIKRIRIVKSSSEPKAEPETVVTVPVPPALEPLTTVVTRILMKRPPMSRVPNNLVSQEK